MLCVHVRSGPGSRENGHAIARPHVGGPHSEKALGRSGALRVGHRASPREVPLTRGVLPRATSLLTPLQVKGREVFPLSPCVHLSPKLVSFLLDCSVDTQNLFKPVAPPTLEVWRDLQSCASRTPADSVPLSLMRPPNNSSWLSSPYSPSPSLLLTLSHRF